MIVWFARGRLLAGRNRNSGHIFRRHALIQKGDVVGKVRAVFSYIDRCQFMLQAGFVCPPSRILLRRPNVPNFSQLKKSDPRKSCPAMITTSSPRKRCSRARAVATEKSFWPDGRVIEFWFCRIAIVISLAGLEKIKELAAAGATVVGPKPAHGKRLENFPAGDYEIAKLADEIWNNKIWNCRVIADKSRAKFAGRRRQWIANFPGCNSFSDFDYITARRTARKLIRSPTVRPIPFPPIGAFRVAGKAPELWNAVSGEHKFAAADEEKMAAQFAAGF